MFNVMKKLIEKHFYKTREEALKKIDVFYACERLTDDEYVDLRGIVDAEYPEEA